MASDHIALLALLHDALGDPTRLRLALLLAQAPVCASELAEAEGESFTTISQRIRVLRADNIIRRRAGKHILDSLADRHMADLIANGLDHAQERDNDRDGGRHNPNHFPRKGTTMATATHEIHENHTHQHDEACGHTAIQHDDYVDYPSTAICTMPQRPLR